jgi:hypothetical protein
MAQQYRGRSHAFHALALEKLTKGEYRTLPLHLKLKRLVIKWIRKGGRLRTRDGLGWKSGTSPGVVRRLLADRPITVESAEAIAKHIGRELKLPRRRDHVDER